LQVLDDYEQNVPELFAAVVFNVATDGKELRFGSIRMPVELWGPWRSEDVEAVPGTLADVKAAVRGLLRPNIVLDILASFTLIDLDAQISATFHASDIPNLVKAETRAELERLLKHDTRKIIITTIHKFGEADGLLNDRDNIIVLVDEAHRTQEGDLGRKMRAA